MAQLFFVGQRVRLMQEATEGIILRKQEPSLWKVRLDDGFEIPVAEADMTPAALEDAVSDPEAFPEEPAPAAQPEQMPGPSEKPTAEAGQASGEAIGGRGPILAFVKQLRPDQLRLHLVNDAYEALLWALYEQRGDGFKPLGHGYLPAGSQQPLGTYDLGAIDKWRPLRMVYHLAPASKTEDPQPAIFEYRFRASSFFRREGYAPHVEAPAFVIEAGADSGRLRNVSSIGAHAPNAAGEKPIATATTDTGVRVVDLHDYALDVSVEAWRPADILQYQLQHCEKVLDEAAREGCSRLIVIHGVGTGKLKKEVRRMLKAHPLVKGLTAAHERDFGQGATEVRLD